MYFGGEVTVKRGHVSSLLLWKAKKRIVTNLKPLDPPPIGPFQSTPPALPHPRVLTHQHILNQNKLPFAAFQFITPTFPTLLFSNKLQS